ncbi:DUF1828 domain-containing protein [Phaeospirillum tilakii]|uniref:DUF1828 domain-containing protein n=1 Tax=Phaeospirillum tilakii TaxID=741673 RepID=A0ABW5CE25_9PROT
MMEMTTAATILDANPLIESVDAVPKGHVRIATAFRYPDGSSVDLFIANRSDLLADVVPVTLTDFGNTFLWLDQLDIRPLKSARRKRQTMDVLEIYDITHAKGALSCEVVPDDLVSGIIRLGQACIRIADLAFTQRITAQGSFVEEVESVIDDTGLDYQTNIKVVGHAGIVVPVDFLIRARRVETAVFTLPAESSNPALAHQRANEVFARSFDLRDWPGQRVAALDDRRQIYRDDDLSRLCDIGTTIIPISDAGTFRDMLMVA